MKKMAISLMALTLVIVSSGLLHAQQMTPDSAYYKFVDKKIDRCEKQAAMLNNSRSEKLQRYSESARKEADFYREHRAELTEVLAEKGVGTRPHQVDSFLEKAFKAGAVDPDKARLASQ
jgi:hypothetical protein